MTSGQINLNLLTLPYQWNHSEIMGHNNNIIMTFDLTCPFNHVWRDCQYFDWLFRTLLSSFCHYNTVCRRYDNIILMYYLYCYYLHRPCFAVLPSRPYCYYILGPRWRGNMSAGSGGEVNHSVYVALPFTVHRMVSNCTVNPSKIIYTYMYCISLTKKPANDPGAN